MSVVCVILYVVVEHDGLASVMTPSSTFYKMDDLGQMTQSFNFRTCKMERIKYQFHTGLKRNTY